MKLPRKHREYLDQLRALIRPWGGEIRFAPDIQTFNGDEYSPAPFTLWDLGVDYSRKIVYFGASGISGKGIPQDPTEFAVSLIHELGHIFACPIAPNEMDDTPGVSELQFLAWEICMAQNMGISLDAYCRANQEFIVNDYTSIGDLLKDPYQLDHLYTGWMAEAVAKGLVQDGHPTSIYR